MVLGNFIQSRNKNITTLPFVVNFVISSIQNDEGEAANVDHLICQYHPNAMEL